MSSDVSVIRAAELTDPEGIGSWLIKQKPTK
jgi:hypothetical protein